MVKSQLKKVLNYEKLHPNSRTLGTVNPVEM